MKNTKKYNSECKGMEKFFIFITFVTFFYEKENYSLYQPISNAEISIHYIISTIPCGFIRHH